MPIYDVIFYFFAVTLVLSALGVVSTKYDYKCFVLGSEFFFKFGFVDDVACRISFVSSPFSCTSVLSWCCFSLS